MANFDQVIRKFRELFSIAKDVKDAEINKSIQEADKLDIKQNLAGYTFAKIPSKMGGGDGGLTIPEGTDNDTDYSIDVEIDEKTYTVVPLYTILCYYAFVRYCKTADQESTSTGLKIQQYNGSIILPDTTKSKRWEEERGKADAFIEDFREVFEKSISSCVCEGSKKNYRICFIK